MDDTFTNKVIDVRVFADAPPMQHENKTFINCVFTGPCNVLFLEHTSMNPIMLLDCDLVVARNGVEISNAVVFKNTTFRKCRLFNLTIFVNKGYEQQFDRLVDDGIITKLTN